VRCVRLRHFLSLLLAPWTLRGTVYPGSFENSSPLVMTGDFAQPGPVFFEHLPKLVVGPPFPSFLRPLVRGSKLPLRVVRLRFSRLVHPRSSLACTIGAISPPPPLPGRPKLLQFVSRDRLRFAFFVLIPLASVDSCNVAGSSVPSAARKAFPLPG